MHYDNTRATSIHVCWIINFENSMFKNKMFLNIPKYFLFSLTKKIFEKDFFGILNTFTNNKINTKTIEVLQYLDKWKVLLGWVGWMWMKQQQMVLSNRSIRPFVHQGCWLERGFFFVNLVVLIFPFI